MSTNLSAFPVCFPLSTRTNISKMWPDWSFLGAVRQKHVVCVQAINKEFVEVIVLVGHLNALLIVHNSATFFSFLCFYSKLTLSCYSNLAI